MATARHVVAVQAKAGCSRRQQHQPFPLQQLLRLGKRITHLKLVDERDMGRPKLWQCAVRYGVLYFGFAPLPFMAVLLFAFAIEGETTNWLLMTLGGTPSIYYGDEQAFRGVKADRPGGDDAVRPAFPATPADLAPFGWPTYRLHQDLIGLRRRHPWLVGARSRKISPVTRLRYAEVLQCESSFIWTCYFVCLVYNYRSHSVSWPGDIKKIIFPVHFKKL